jgi:hypothetical protein
VDGIGYGDYNVRDSGDNYVTGNNNTDLDTVSA